MIKRDTENWSYDNKMIRPWFRGEKNADYILMPSVLRNSYDEASLSNSFRNRAAALPDTPDRGEIDKWLFLMQHVGLPTRLLDWTESALAALFFAVREAENRDPAVWMLHPGELNRISGIEGFPGTWKKDSRARDNFLYAYGEIYSPTPYPIAIQPAYVHQRMFAQKSGFTIHGSENVCIESLTEANPPLNRQYLIKYVMSRKNAEKILDDLQTLGITESSLFPEFGGLAKELKLRFRIE